MEKSIRRLKREKILCNLLFVIGFILLAVALYNLVIQIQETISYDYKSIVKVSSTVSYFIIQYSTIIFEIILALYAIRARKQLDDVINPLFTFTVLYSIFVAFQTIYFFSLGGFSNFNITACVADFTDLFIASFLLIFTLIFKIDDWRPYEKESVQ